MEILSHKNRSFGKIAVCSFSECLPCFVHWLVLWQRAEKCCCQMSWWVVAGSGTPGIFLFYSKHQAMLENRSVGKMGMQQQQATAGKEFSRDKQSSLSNGHVEEKCLSANVQVWPPEQTSGRQFQDAGMDRSLFHLFYIIYQNYTINLIFLQILSNSSHLPHSNGLSPFLTTRDWTEKAKNNKTKIQHIPILTCL